MAVAMSQKLLVEVSFFPEITGNLSSDKRTISWRMYFYQVKKNNNTSAFKSILKFMLCSFYNNKKSRQLKNLLLSR